MQANILKRVLPFCLTLIVGIGVTVAIGKLFHSKSRTVTVRVSESYSGHRKYPYRHDRAIAIRSVPDGQLPPLFDSQFSEGHANIRMEALFDSSGRVTEVRFPEFGSYGTEAVSENQRRSQRIGQELMDFSAQQVREIQFKPSPFSQWLNIETFISKKAPGRGCSSVKVKISDQDGMRWEGETLAEGRRCGANFSSF